jgi:hypothetical protein
VIECPSIGGRLPLGKNRVDGLRNEPAGGLTADRCRSNKEVWVLPFKETGDTKKFCAISRSSDTPSQRQAGTSGTMYQLPFDSFAC